MHCNGCNTDLAARVRIRVHNEKLVESCDICAKEPAVWLPDVYLGGQGGIQTNENLCNSNGEPIPYQTKREKAAIMKMLKVREADSAEHQHGSRNEMYLHRRKYVI